MMRRTMVAVVCLVSASAAQAVDFKQMQLANGLVEIMNKASPCGYEIDDTALEAYYVDNGLATPELLSFISAGVSLSEYDDPPSSSDCTLARTTARAIGILTQ